LSTCFPLSPIHKSFDRRLMNSYRPKV
jgi:hypothetical protein